MKNAKRGLLVCMLAVSGAVGCADVDGADDLEMSEENGGANPALSEGALMQEGAPLEPDEFVPVEPDLIVPDWLHTDVTGQVPEEKKVFSAQPLSRVTDTSTLPARAVVQLVTTYKNGVKTRCTGTVVGSDSVLTAAHCLYNKSRGGFAASITIVPGRKDDGTPPFGTFSAKAGFCPQQYQDNDGTDAKVPYDYGIIRTKTTLGQKATITVLANPLNQALRLRGYPDDAQPNWMYTSLDKVRTTFGNGLFYHQASTLSGMSGAGVMFNSNVFGVHVGETPDGKNNDGVLITSTVKAKLDDWMTRVIP